MTPFRLSFYLSRRYLLILAGSLIVLWALVYLFDTVELLRRSESTTESFRTVLRMGLFKLPDVGQQMIPFAILFSALITFWHLTKTQELIVMRASGLSVWQFLQPVMMCAFIVGIFHIMILNTIGAGLLSHYEAWENRTLRKQSSAIELSDSGLWLRQSNDQQSVILHAGTIQPQDWELDDVMVLFFDKNDRFIQRIDAPKAVLQNSAWQIDQSVLTKPEQDVPVLGQYTLPTDLTPKRIQERFAKPETISFWRLPNFMKTIQKAGLSITALRLHYQTLLAQPFLYAALILLAASFALRLPRSGYVLTLIVAGLITGFVIFLLKDVTEALGSANILPTLLAAWTPALLALCSGSAALLYLEDG